MTVFCAIKLLCVCSVVCFVTCLTLKMPLPKLSKLSKSELVQLCNDRAIDSTEMDREAMMAALWRHEEEDDDNSPPIGGAVGGYQAMPQYNQNLNVEALKLQLTLQREAAATAADQRAADEVRIKREIEFKREEMQFQREQQAFELERLRLQQANRETSSVSGSTAPKMPKYVEGEDIEVFIATFEKLATANGWDKTIWAPRFGAVLTGKAQEAYSRLSLEDSKDYEKIKSAILRKYELSAEAYRRKFRFCKKKSDETFRE